MNVQALYIVDRKKSILVFFKNVNNDIIPNHKNLSKILDKIIFYCQTKKINSFHKLNIEDKHYSFGIFNDIIIIIHSIHDNNINQSLISELAEKFIKKFGKILPTYSTDETSTFKSFSDDVKLSILKESSLPLKRFNIKPLNPIKEPLDRDYYPEKISVFEKDEILWKQAKLIKDNYPAEFIDGFIFKLQVYISISSTQNYKMFINFSKYPLKPQIEIDEALMNQLDGSLDDLLFFYRTWNRENPPHIIELIREFESVLWQYNANGLLPENSSLVSNMIPKLKPLKNGLEKKEKKK
ncbi:MAG: hypothetical protein ACFFAO_05765 [Candidatus Hermodarchaeota archaeon]